MKITIKRTIGIVGVSALVLSFQSASAQSFGSLIKDVKKLEEALTKKEEEPKAKEIVEPEQSTTARNARPGQLPSSGRSTIPRKMYNCDDNSALHIEGTPMAIQTPPVLCLPAKSFAENVKYTFDIRGQTIPTTVDELKNCQVSSGNVGNSEYKGTVAAVKGLMFCNINGINAELNIQTNKDVFFVDQFMTPVCGPEINVAGSEWDTRIIEKYNFGGDDYIADDREEYRKELAAGTKEMIYIRKGSKSRRCDANQVAWYFSIVLPRNNELNQLFIDAVTKSQSAGDDF